MTLINPVLLIMAGGTGGHIFPGIAIADTLKEKGWQVHWLGAKNSMEEQIVPAHDIALSVLTVTAVRGTSIKRKILAPVRILRAIVEAKKHMKNISPDIVLGMGGFASGPGGIAAWLSHIPLLIHEQNAIAGYTNRILSHFSKIIACAFPTVFPAKYHDKIRLIGNPVRKDICRIAEPKIRLCNRNKNLRLLIVGGSRGAQILNKIVPESLKSSEKIFSVRHQCGQNNFATVDRNYAAAVTQGHQITVMDFIHDMAESLAWADIIICRSGALTVSELMCVGLASVLVPYPYAVDDHQTANGKILQEKNAAIMFQQKDFTAENLHQCLRDLSHQKVNEMSQKAFDEKAKFATENLARLCESLVGGKAA